MTASRILGLLSGTSADGIDAALAELPGWSAPEDGERWPRHVGGRWPGPQGGVPPGRVVEHVFTAFSPELRVAVLAAMRDEANAADLTHLQAHGFSDEAREAAAFALLGYARAQGWADVRPQVTGARVAVGAGEVMLPPPEEPR